MHIAVLYGGVSAERAVSLSSGKCVAQALRSAGEEVTELILDSALPSDKQRAALFASDAVFLALHGGAGEDGSVQRCLEEWGIYHYTGSDARGSALAMDKAAAKTAVQTVGVVVARGVVLREKQAAAPLAYPFIVKPLTGGSSLGLRLIDSEKAWGELQISEALLCERFLTGREFSVGVLDGRALPPVEICPRAGLFDYEHKYVRGKSAEICPAPVSSAERITLQNLALLAFSALGLRDYARVDFKEGNAGELCFLEANTLPGMTDCSLLPLAASHAGLDFTALCQTMATLAAKRRK